MQKKVMISQPFPLSFTTKYDDFVKALEAKDCEVYTYPEEANLSEEKLLKVNSDIFAAVCGTDKWTAKAIENAKQLKIISRIGVGYDSIDIPAATKAGVVVCTTPGFGAEPVAEEALAMMLAVGRQLKQGDHKVRTKWGNVISMGIYRKTLGIVGMGIIGKTLAKAVKGFDMKILAYDKFRDAAFAKEHGITYVSLDELLRESDYVSIHTSLNDETRGLIGERELGLMKPLSVLINCARGGIVDENALYNALKARKIFGAGFDVFTKEPLPSDSPLLTLDNLITMPHNAGTSYDGRNANCGRAVQNVIDFIDGKSPVGVLNPEVMGLKK